PATGAATCTPPCCGARTGCSRRARGCSTGCSRAAWRRWWRTSASTGAWTRPTSPSCVACWRRSTMASADLLAWLGQSTLAASIAVVAVLLARRLMRRLFGARVAYALWALVPLALLAVAMPAPDPAGHGPAVVAAVAALQVHAAGAGAAAGSAPLLWAWAAGVLASAALFGIAQRRFVRSLGPLRPRADGLHQAAGAHGLPAVIGLVRPRIVVPPDFASCYDDTERRLVRLHEQLHIRSGDLVANAAAIALRCLFWFNPLVHLAWRHFRHDQELACDQRVLERHPRKRRQYGAAMLKTQLAASPLPLACTWGYGHPLK